MRRSVMFAVGLLAMPATAQAQLEVGIDAGMTLSNGFETGDDVTEFTVPTSYARIGVGAGSALSIETLLRLGYFSSGDDSANAITLMPGANFSFGSSGGYVRGEVAVTRLGSDNGTTSSSRPR